jgi:hypothetical protein
MIIFRISLPFNAPEHMLLMLCALRSTTAQAQWLNFRTPGTPRTPDGKPDLTAPAPCLADGKPDLSGAWMHELTSLAEMKRLFGDWIDAAVKVDVPGMEIGTQHKYSFDILEDFKNEEAMLRPKAVEALRRRGAETNPAAVCGNVAGIRDFGHLDIEMTFDDPVMYTQPFTIKVPYEILADSDIFESFCSENERDSAHLKKP